jgi:hypothetical protein
VEVATKIFWALGYNQVESYLTTFDMKHVEIDPKRRFRRPSGARTPSRTMTSTRSSRLSRGKRTAPIASVAGRLIPGKILGGYLYDGTRPDDPNDVVAHEHRRELRALRVFGAWTNLTDLKARIRSTRSSPRTAARSSNTICRTSARPLACATITTNGT